MSNSNRRGLRFDIAKSIQNYRLIKLLPVYTTSELREVVDAWLPIIEEAGISDTYFKELFNFALIRRGDKFGFGADDLAREWIPFKETIQARAYQTYYEAVECSDDLKIAVAKKSLDDVLTELSPGAKAAAELDRATYSDS